MRAAYAPYRLRFKAPSSTSRGILLEKETYFIKLWEDETPKVYGIGECALFRGLSKEDTPDYESKLGELCDAINSGVECDLDGYSSIIFGLEGAKCDLANGGKRIYYQTPFVDGEQQIPINGLIWMGSKDEMLTRVMQKINSGFRTLKLKIGGISFDEELRILSSVRERFSIDELEIRLDANGAFAPNDALSKLEQLSKYQIHSIEQPIKAGNWAAMRDVVNSSPIPIVLDEELIGITNHNIMVELLESINPDYIILKPSLMGGIANSEHWIALALERGIGYWITSALESNIGLSHIAQWVSTLDVAIPQGLGTGALYHNNIPSPLEQKGDYLINNPSLSWEIPPLDWL
ncbi:MAG: o-succinylbenzoate synthase [Bacteroidales bacterium]